MLALRNFQVSASGILFSTNARRDGVVAFPEMFRTVTFPVHPHVCGEHMGIHKNQN